MASEEETGGGEGVEVVFNEPFDVSAGVHAPITKLLDGASRWNNGQYTLKWYRFGSRIPWLIRKVVTRNALDMREEAWNAFPYCRTIVTVCFPLTQSHGHLLLDLELFLELFLRFRIFLGIILKI